MSQAAEFWEKTVEYAFVVAASKAERLDLALPLSGKPERAAGDAIFGSKARLVLVEFKRGKTQVESERSLFHDYDEARQSLSGIDSHHFLIYPSWPQQPTISFNLFAETYFSRVACAGPLDCLARGKDPENFRSYLDALFSWKVPDGRASSGQIGAHELAQVIGVSGEGKLLEVVTLQEYAPDLFPEQEANSENAADVHQMRNGPK
jgi:hypothetical protein